MPVTTEPCPSQDPRHWASGVPHELCADIPRHLVGDKMACQMCAARLCRAESKQGGCPYNGQESQCLKTMSCETGQFIPHLSPSTVGPVSGRAGANVAEGTAEGLPASGGPSSQGIPFVDPLWTKDYIVAPPHPQSRSDLTETFDKMRYDMCAEQGGDHETCMTMLPVFHH